MRAIHFLSIVSMVSTLIIIIIIIIINNYYFALLVGGAYAMSSFQEIARTTGGKSGPLDLSSTKGAEDLKDIVTTKVLSSIGGEELESKYFEMKKRGFL